MAHSITPQAQPTRTTCGQTCVAMIVGQSVASVVARCGGTRTTPRDLREMFERYGFTMVSRHCCKLPEYPRVLADTILYGHTVKEHTLHSHWMVWNGAHLFDPTGGVQRGLLEEDWSGRFYIVYESVQ